MFKNRKIELENGLTYTVKAHELGHFISELNIPPSAFNELMEKLIDLVSCARQDAYIQGIGDMCKTYGLKDLPEETVKAMPEGNPLRITS